jgi:tRNA (guanine-N7-)-methyltransferase
MPEQAARPVHSNQQGLHPDLEKIVRRHQHAPYRRPSAQHTLEAFASADAWVRASLRPVVLDSGCGTGESSLNLAARFPFCSVLGIDKSEVRLDKAALRSLPENVRFLRADLQDFWPLVARSGWDVRYHALYYPNPWPKSAHLMRRFHGHPVFPILLGLSPVLELRTNWLLYAQEFARATEIILGHSSPAQRLSAPQPITAFERKYAAAGQSLWSVVVNPPQKQ